MAAISMFCMLSAQTLTYTGKVVDQAGIGLPWALIRAEGSTVVAQSNAEGSFTFTGPYVTAIRSPYFRWEFPSPSRPRPGRRDALPGAPAFRTDGRILDVTQAAAGPRFREAVAPGSEGSAAPLLKAASAYALTVSKVNYQEGRFPQAAATGSGLTLTLQRSATDTATYAAEKKLCLDTINACRATMGLKPLLWSKSLEAFADEGARYDAAIGKSHVHFGKFSAAAVPSDAENAIPDWPLKDFKTVAAVVQKGTQMMWDERLNPSGEQGHYLTLKGDQTLVGCGVFVTSGGGVWVVQDFK